VGILLTSSDVSRAGGGEEREVSYDVGPGLLVGLGPRGQLLGTIPLCTCIGPTVRVPGSV